MSNNYTCGPKKNEVDMPHRNPLTSQAGAVPPSSEHKKVDEVQSILDRWDERLQNHQHQKRREKRTPFRGEILVGIPAMQARSIGRPATPARKACAWARNVSGNGISFLCQDRIDADEITICLEPRAEAPRWYGGKIVRRREVQNDFWEYGVQLMGRAESKSV